MVAVNRMGINLVISPEVFSNRSTSADMQCTFCISISYHVERDDMCVSRCDTQATRPHIGKEGCVGK